MKQYVYGWQTSEEGNALSAVLAGKEAPFVPVAPLFVDAPFRGYVDERLCGMWERRIKESRKDRLEVDFDTYVRSRFEVICEIIDRFNSPPCWVRFPWTSSRWEIEGCQVARKDRDLIWVDADGKESPLTEKLRLLDKRPGPWPMQRPTRRSLREVKGIVEGDPESLVQPESLGDPGSRWEGASGQDFSSAGCLKVWDWVRERYQGAMPSYIIGACPTQFAMDVMGFESLMVGFLEEPEAVHRILRLGMPRNRAYWKAVREAGVEVVHLSEYSWGGVISPGIYRQFIKPYSRELIDFYHGLGFKVLLYVMGNIMPLLEEIAEQPFDALAIEEGRKGYELEVGEVRRRLGDERVLFGNVPCMLVEKGRPEDILAEVRRQISVAGEKERFVVSIGEPIPPGTQPERVRFFCDSTRLI